MERTQRLLSIALAVLALDGCRGPQQAARPQPSGSPGSSTRTSAHSSFWHGSSFHHHYHSGAAAAGAFFGGAAAGRGMRGGGMHGGGFGHAGGHGGG